MSYSCILNSTPNTHIHSSTDNKDIKQSMFLTSVCVQSITKILQIAEEGVEQQKGILNFDG